MTIDDIRPYNDAEAVKSLRNAARKPLIDLASLSYFGDPFLLKKKLRKVESVKQFQEEVMIPFLDSILDKTTAGLSYEGTENIPEGGCLFISNHRDIVLDPAYTEYMLIHMGELGSDICVGSNLLSNKTVEDLMRSNRMVKVMRGASPRKTYESSVLLSNYIRERIAGQGARVWIAQKEGRAKRGIDETEAAVLKMLQMSGNGDFVEDFDALKIVPLTISYEYEPCGAFKARETLMRSKGPYRKKKNEDMASILEGFSAYKGGIHITVGKPVSRQELDQIERKGQKNARISALKDLLDNRIKSGYMLFKTNYMAHDLLTGEFTYRDKYTKEELSRFASYVDSQIKRTGHGENRNDLKKIFLEIYSNPLNR